MFYIIHVIFSFIIPSCSRLNAISCNMKHHRSVIFVNCLKSDFSRIITCFFWKKINKERLTFCFVFSQGRHTNGSQEWKLLPMLLWILRRSFGEIRWGTRLYLWTCTGWRRQVGYTWGKLEEIVNYIYCSYKEIYCQPCIIFLLIVVIYSYLN